MNLQPPKPDKYIYVNLYWGQASIVWVYNLACHANSLGENLIFFKNYADDLRGQYRLYIIVFLAHDVFICGNFGVHYSCTYKENKL